MKQLSSSCVFDLHQPVRCLWRSLPTSRSLCGRFEEADWQNSRAVVSSIPAKGRDSKFDLCDIVVLIQPLPRESFDCPLVEHLNLTYRRTASLGVTRHLVSGPGQRNSPHSHPNRPNISKLGLRPVTRHRLALDPLTHAYPPYIVLQPSVLQA
jgi:hypothetical protein